MWFKIYYCAITITSFIIAYHGSVGAFEQWQQTQIPLSLALSILFWAVPIILIISPFIFYPQEAKERLWLIIHNLIAHPLLCINSRKSSWFGRFHDWTASKMIIHN